MPSPILLTVQGRCAIEPVWEMTTVQFLVVKCRGGLNSSREEKVAVSSLRFSLGEESSSRELSSRLPSSVNKTIYVTSGLIKTKVMRFWNVLKYGFQCFFSRVFMLIFK